MNKTQLIEAINDMKVYKAISEIERELQMPRTTLQKAVKGYRKLPRRWLKPVADYFGKPFVDRPKPVREMPPKPKPVVVSPETVGELSVKLQVDAVEQEAREKIQEYETEIASLDDKGLGAKRKKWLRSKIAELKEFLK